MLIGVLDGFQDTEFWHVDCRIIVANGEDRDGFPSGISGRPSIRQEEKWWLLCPRVPPSGLSEEARKSLLQCRDCSNQILKAAMAINSSVLAEMDIPRAFIETLPKIAEKKHLPLIPTIHGHKVTISNLEHCNGCSILLKVPASLTF
ncbi:PRONE domain [Dillenia turbinata]|uniref:PRONE domain n=1 Tax=Dillenia turbinata TaxID=194707 RepID=A0AAN8UTD0_9MAGN